MSRKAEGPDVYELVNGIVEQAVERSWDVLKPIIDLLYGGGRLPFTVPVTIKTLGELPADEAVSVIAQMIREPATRAEGVKLLRQALEKAGQTNGARQSVT